MVRRGVVSLTVGLALWPMAAGAGSVRLVSRADGTTLMVNEGAGDRERRLADRLLAIPDNARLPDLIAEHASRQRLEPTLVQAVIQVESGYNPKALSTKGAMGLMQLMPGTARELGVRDPWDPAENVRGGTTYLRRMLDLFEGQEDLALAAYNAGPGAVQRHGGIPPYAETQQYVDRILRLCEQNGMVVIRSQASGSSTSAGSFDVESTASGPRVRLKRDGANRIVITNTH